MYTLVLLSGGQGLRMKNSIPKQFMLLAGKPVIMHTLERVDKIHQIREVIIVCSEEYIQYIKELLKQYNIKTIVRFAIAGNTRQSSVFSGLKLVETSDVIIHEAARPFVSIEEFERLINSKNKNVIMGTQIPFTVLIGKSRVDGILSRDKLINVQLPQKFSTDILLESHIRAEKEKRAFTEDSSMIYFYHNECDISIIEGADYNIKLTTPIDMIIGEVIYKEFFARRK